MSNIRKGGANRRLAARLALLLSTIWAVTGWNVVFNRVPALAGRQSVHAAALSAGASGPYLRPGDWMRPAIGRGFRLAPAAAGGILAVALVANPAASRRTRSSAPCTQATT